MAQAIRLAASEYLDVEKLGLDQGFNA